MSFDLSDYVDVAERIRIFRESHPTGSLQSEVTLDPAGEWVLCKAFAYRSPEDAIPGVGHSRLAIPGTTPYTRGSEVENAETSAWGRAIVAALAADTKRIASSDEVRTKVDESAGSPNAANGGGALTTTSPGEGAATTNGAWVWPSGKYQGKTLAETPESYLAWYAEQGPRADAKAAIAAYLAIEASPTLDAVIASGGIDGDIPFEPTMDATV